MKKEYSLVAAAVFFLVSYIIDKLAGGVLIVVKSPNQFIFDAIYLQYPFTSFAIALKVGGLFITIVLLLSFIEKAYFKKAIITFLLAFTAQLYAIQQTATGARTTPIQWTLAIAYTGVLLVIPTIYYLIKGIVTLLYSGLSSNQKAKEKKEKEKEDEEEEEE